MGKDIRKYFVGKDIALVAESGRGGGARGKTTSKNLIPLKGKDLLLPYYLPYK
jgi:hypothetical protein